MVQIAADQRLQVLWAVCLHDRYLHLWGQNGAVSDQPYLVVRPSSTVALAETGNVTSKSEVRCVALLSYIIGNVANRRDFKDMLHLTETPYVSYSRPSGESQLVTRVRARRSH